MYARLRPMTAALVALLVTAMTLAVAPAAQAVTYADPAGEIIKQTNAHRASHDGLGGLTRSAAIDSVAQAWAEKLAADYAAARSKNPSASPRDYLKHNPNFASQIPTGWKAAGENVAWNSRHSDPVTTMVGQWIKSPGHHDNIASTSYTHIGVGFYTDKYGVSWGVQVFAKYTGTNPDQDLSSMVTGDEGADTLAVRRGSTYYGSNTLGNAIADWTVNYGRSGDVVLVGDWDGDGVDTFAVRRGSTYYVKNSLSAGNADKVFTYGRSSDEVLVGDWDGDGEDTFAVRRGNTYYVKNSLAAGGADKVFSYGRSGDVVLVGDWEGDGGDTFAVRRGNMIYVSYRLTGGDADRAFAYGRDADVVLVGDWDGNGADTVAVRRGSSYYFNNSLTGGDADASMRYGRSTDEVLVGDWDAK